MSLVPRPSGRRFSSVTAFRNSASRSCSYTAPTSSSVSGAFSPVANWATASSLSSSSPASRCALSGLRSFARSRCRRKVVTAPRRAGSGTAVTYSIFGLPEARWRSICASDLLDALLRERESLNEEVLGDLVRAGLHHHDRVARAGDDEVELALEHLLDRRVERELAVHRADANAADRSLERSVRERQRRRRRVHGKDVVVVFLIRGPGGDDDLNVVAEALWKERADRAVGQARGKDPLLRRTALAAREGA